ncbi:MAG: HAMP domain-containing sensor histidine kinase [Candidatus Limnocylindrales bacterium]
MSGIDLGRLRWRLLAANLAVAAAGVLAVAAGVWLAAPRAFESAMGMGGPGGGMMGGAGVGMMDPALSAAFGNSVGSALLLGLAAAVLVAVVASVLVATRLSRPIDELAAASRRVARGDYLQRIPPGDGELGELADSFNQMAAALASTEQRRRDLIGDVAHELRTPIASVRGYVEGLEAGVFAPGPETWRVLDEQTARLERLVDDLAVLWRAESNDLRLEIEPVDAATAIADAVEGHRALAASRRIVLALETAMPAAPRATLVRADPVRLAQVLDNLVVNALRYTNEAGHVWLGVGREGAWIAFSVADDGPGLEPEQAARVFERFYRADPSRSREAGGSGLGLAITRSLVEAMGGTIAVSSPGPGRGARFTVRLPAA